MGENDIEKLRDKNNKTPEEEREFKLRESVIAEFGQKEGENPNPLLKPKTGQEPPSLEEFRTSLSSKIEELKNKEDRTLEEDEELSFMEALIEPENHPMPVLSEKEIDKKIEDLREKIESLRKPPEER